MTRFRIGALILAALWARAVPGAELLPDGWGPLRLVPPDEKSSTSANGTWSVRGVGNTVYLAYVREISNVLSVWFIRSSDAGRTWDDATHTQISTEGAYGAHSPSLVMVGPDNEIAVVYAEYEEAMEDGKVWAKVSMDGGQNWTARQAVSLSSTRCDQPSAASHDNNIEVAWRQVATGDSTIHGRAGTVGTDGGISWSSGSLPISNGTGYQWKEPTVYRPSDSRAGCAYAGYYSSTGRTFGEWHTPGVAWPDSTKMISDENRDYHRPSGTILNSSTENQDTEFVAYEATAIHPRLVLAWRDNYNFGDWSRADFSFMPDLDLFRPSLWGQNHSLNIAYTDIDGQEIKRVHFSRTREVDNHYQIWRTPLLLGVNADSASLSFSGDHDDAYLVFSFHNTTTTCVAFRKGSYRWHVPANVLTPNCSRKLVRTTGTNKLHHVRVDDNYVNYVRSDNDGEDWTFQNAPDYGSDPALALSSTGNPWCAYRRNDSILVAVMKPDSTWTIKTIFAGSSSKRPGPPSLAVFNGTSGRIANIAFPMYDLDGGGHSYILFAQADSNGAVVLDTVHDNANASKDSAACIAVGVTDSVYVVYQSNDSIYYRTLIYAPNSMTSPDTWSSAEKVNESGWDGRHPYCERYENYLYATWRQHSTGEMGTYVTIKRAGRLVTGQGDGWEGMTDISSASSCPKDYPTLSTDKVVVWSESSGTHWRIKAKVADSTLFLTSADSNAKCCWVVAETSVADAPATLNTKIKYLWTQKTNGDTCQVAYQNNKDVKVSTADGNVTRYNNGTKMTRSSSDSLYCIWRNRAGAVYCSQKIDDPAAGWSSIQVAASGDLPAVCKDFTDRLWAAYRYDDARGISYAYRSVGSATWSTNSICDYNPVYWNYGATVGAPAIAGALCDSATYSGNAAYVVFAVRDDDGKPPQYRILLAKAHTSGGGLVYLDTLDMPTSSNDSLPAIALRQVENGYYVCVAWQHDNDIYYKVSALADHPDRTQKLTWDGPYDISNTNDPARHPFIAVGSDSARVAWTQRDVGRIMVKSQAVGSAYNSWSDTVPASNSADTVDFPTISIGDSVIVCYQRQSGAGNSEIYARVNFHTGSASNFNISNTNTASSYGHVLFDMHNGTTPIVHCVWTEDLSANYSEVGYKRYELGVEGGGGGGGQSAAIIDPGIRPMLCAPVPNPFRGLTNLRYQTNIAGRVRITIYDLSGREVRTLVNAGHKPGVFNVNWSGTDNRQRMLSEGIYFVRFDTPNFHESRKLVLMN